MAKDKRRITNTIRELRKGEGLTQADLARRVGATRQTLIAIEAEKYAPTLELAMRIAEEFGVPFDEVFRFAE